ncbi:MAG: hypothetical protein ACRC10_09975 [Thermoguttaceae bacterium]
MKRFSFWAVILFLFLPFSLTAQEEEPEKYTLKYTFREGDVFRWDVLQQLLIKTTISTKTEIVDTTSQSTKTWTVLSVEEDGSALIEHRVEEANMHKRQSDLPDSTYNSKTDTLIPPGYEHVANSLNTPLTQLTVAPNGQILKKISFVPHIPDSLESKILIPLPKTPVAVGETWKLTNEVAVPQANGMVKKLMLQQIFTLKSVKTGLATIQYKTVCLTPIDDPKLESQIMDRLISGEVILEIETGHILSQQSDIRGTVLGFEGANSRIDQSGRFVEKMKKEP